MEKAPIHVFAKWKVKAGEINKVLALLPEVVKESAAEKGNLFYQIHQDNTDPDTLLLFEGYEDEAALNDHRKSAHFQNLIVSRIVPLLEAREVNLTTPLVF